MIIYDYYDIMDLRNLPIYLEVAGKLSGWEFQIKIISIKHL